MIIPKNEIENICKNCTNRNTCTALDASCYGAGEFYIKLKMNQLLNKTQMYSKDNDYFKCKLKYNFGGIKL